MNFINENRFDLLLKWVHDYPMGKYELYDNEAHFVEAAYDTDYESDNGLDEDDDGYEEFQCIVFKRITDGKLFEVNHHQIPVKAVCNGHVIY